MRDRDLAGGPSRRPGGQTIVNDDRRSPGEIDTRVNLSDALNALPNLVKLTFGDRCELRLAHVFVTLDLGVENANASFTDCAERQFGLRWDTKFANYQDVKGRAENVGDLTRHRNSTTR
jgi:hypothetical protein